MNKCIVTCVEKGVQCATILTALLITLNAMIPISTLQYLETSPLSPHSTPEHDFIGQHAKTLQAGGQEDQPRSARTVKSSSNFSLQAETLPFFSVSVSDSASSVGLSLSLSASHHLACTSSTCCGRRDQRPRMWITS
jgi:hypothetical protein